MFNTLLGILLVLTVGLCVMAFPFVLWLLFSTGPRSRHRRHPSRPREVAGSSGWGEERRRVPSRYDEADEDDDEDGWQEASGRRSNKDRALVE
jgi:hypothetical protein